MADPVNLSPKDRAKRYRELAADARREAGRVKSNENAVRESYQIIATQFERLARAAESEIVEDGR